MPCQSCGACCRPPRCLHFCFFFGMCLPSRRGSLHPLSPKLSVFLLGALCGFPVGAVVCERMCESGALAKRDAARLLPFVNGASPAFLFGAAGSLFGDWRIGYSCAKRQAARRTDR